MLVGAGYNDRCLTEAEARDVFSQGLARRDLAGRKVLAIVPDSTRSAPLPLVFRVLNEMLGSEVAQLDFLVALGTHAPMDEGRLCRMLGITPGERATRYARVGIYNHDWRRDITRVGTIPASELAELSDGRMTQEVPVEVNRRILEYDHVLICGPVFPHEAAGFSGGSKYLFPGTAGPSVINTLHWLSALITNAAIIGKPNTPVRQLIERAATRVDVPISCFSMVVRGHEDLAGLYFGSPRESQEAAAALSAQVHIRYVERPFQTVLSIMPEMYEDLWTAGKGMYKLEPVVADEGTLIIYAPHVREISHTHGALLGRLGYHVRDYFLKHWEETKDAGGCVLAHSTLVKGAGTYENGVERPRVNVVLATGIPREECERVNLGYLDPNSIHLEEWTGREDEGILVVPRAGEMLYRLAG